MHEIQIISMQKNNTIKGSEDSIDIINYFEVPTVDSSEECGCTCASTRGCTSFDWDNGIEGCYLKNAVGEPTANTHLLSGVLNC